MAVSAFALTIASIVCYLNIGVRAARITAADAAFPSFGDLGLAESGHDVGAMGPLDLTILGGNIGTSRQGVIINAKKFPNKRTAATETISPNTINMMSFPGGFANPFFPLRKNVADPSALFTNGLLNIEATPVFIGSGVPVALSTTSSDATRDRLNVESNGSNPTVTSPGSVRLHDPTRIRGTTRIVDNLRPNTKNSVKSHEPGTIQNDKTVRHTKASQPESSVNDHIKAKALQSNVAAKTGIGKRGKVISDSAVEKSVFGRQTIHRQLLAFCIR